MCLALLCVLQNHLESSLKKGLGPTQSLFRLRRDPRICISRNFPGDADVASSGISLLIENDEDKKN